MTLHISVAWPLLGLCGGSCPTLLLGLIWIPPNQRQVKKLFIVKFVVKCTNIKCTI